jgi:outer membrane protein OmpA-like peptidoglycan-associated protein
MFMLSSQARRAAAFGAVIAAFGLSGCAAKVTRKDFDSEVAKIRDEMSTGDRQLATRIDSTNALVADHDRRLAALEQELQAFRSEYNVSIEKMKDGLKFNVPVHFDFGSAELREADRPVLERFASVVKEHYPSAAVTVEGFADPAGSTRYNQRLGQQRADAVREYLTTTASFPETQLKAVSYGEARNRQVVPGAKGPGDAGLPNRRVALVIDYASMVGTEQVSSAY